MTKAIEEAPECRAPLVVGLGEALFDCYSDRVVLGGAPLNLAHHANQLLQVCQGRGVVASRIGEDSLANDLRMEMEARGLTHDFVQSDPLHGTGQVRVTVSPKGEPSYQILEDAAWDHLKLDGDFRSSRRTVPQSALARLPNEQKFRVQPSKGLS